MRTLLSLVLVGLVAGAWVRADDKPQGDLGKLQGKWKVLVGPEKDIPVTLTIKNKTVKASFPNQDGEDRSIQGEIVLDEKASPRTLDWVHFPKMDGSGFAEPNLAIYKIESDTFTVCNGGPGKPRPTEFKNGDDNGPPNLLEFKRVKDETK